MTTFPHVFQYPFAVLQEKGFEMRGRWNELFFKNTHPIVLELGCGKGEYTVGLARCFPDKNFIGVDIKGARIWTGAKQALEEGLPNVAFLRTHIELLAQFFAAGEVAEIWITFPDPQMNKTNKRMTSARFMQLYSKIIVPQALIHLKTDSMFMFAYTQAMARVNCFPVVVESVDLYHDYPSDDRPFAPTQIQTFYEKQWRERGIDIKYLCFVMEPRETYIEPEIDIARDDYRSFGRSAVR